MDTKIYKTMVAQGGAILKMDTIHHDGRYWLVPDWLVSPDGMKMKPRIAIDMTAIRHDTLGSPMGDFLVNSPLPPGATEGEIVGPMAKIVQILHAPELWYTNPDKLH